MLGSFDALIDVVKDICTFLNAYIQSSNLECMGPKMTFSESYSYFNKTKYMVIKLTSFDKDIRIKKLRRFDLVL